MAGALTSTMAAGSGAPYAATGALTSIMGAGAGKGAGAGEGAR